MGTVWERTTEFCGSALATIIPIAVLLIFLPQTVQGNLSPLINQGDAAAMLALRLISFAMSIVMLLGQVSIVALAIEPQMSATRSIAFAARRMPAVVAAIFMLMIAITLLSIPAFALMLAAGIDPTQPGALSSKTTVPLLSVSPAIAWSLIVYLIVAIVIGFWLSARMILTYPVAVAERRGWRVLPRSFALTRGLALRIIGAVVLYAIVSTVATLAVRTVFGAVLAIIAGGVDPLSIGGVVMAVAVAAVATTFTVLGSAFTAKLYVAVTGRPVITPGAA